MKIVHDRNLNVRPRVLEIAGTLSKYVGLGLAVTVAVAVPWSALVALDLRFSPRLPRGHGLPQWQRLAQIHCCGAQALLSCSTPRLGGIQLGAPGWPRRRDVSLAALCRLWLSFHATATGLRGRLAFDRFARSRARRRGGNGHCGGGRSARLHADSS